LAWTDALRGFPGPRGQRARQKAKNINGVIGHSAILAFFHSVINIEIFLLKVNHPEAGRGMEQQVAAKLIDI
jgi:hypothetical protein